MSLTKQAWIRYFARVIDIFLGTVIVLFILGVMFITGSLIFKGTSTYYLEQATDLTFRIIEMIGMVIYFFIEAAIISKYGTTPAKKLFGISLSNENGEKLDYKTALGRGFTLWFRGLGLGLPIISFITLAITYSNYTQDGQTTWDKNFNTVVSYKIISPIRFIVGITIFISIFVLLFLMH